MSNRIEPLAEHVIAQVSSTKEIRDLKRVVLGLLENSLDASSSKVTVSINLDKRSCTVEDNGCGIVSDEFAPGSGLCRRHHTSKALLEPPQYHSSDGTFLHSLAALSLLCITSKTTDAEAQAYLCLHQGQRLPAGERVPSVHQLTAFPKHGTRVFVDDAFGTLPVRVKQHALQLESSRTRSRFFHDTVHSIVALLLAWPQPCSVRISDELGVCKSVTLTASHPRISHDITTRALSKLASQPAFTLQDKLSLLFQADIVSERTRRDWIPVSASSSRFKLKGLICSAPCPHTQSQFLSIGVTPLTNEKDLSELYTVINGLFNKSTFGVLEDEQGRTQKGVDRWPMFIVNIIVLDQVQKHVMLEKLSRFLREVVSQWLAAQGFKVRSLRRTRSQMQESPSATLPTSSQGRNERACADSVSDASPAPANEGQSWTRVKYARTTSASSLPTRSHTLSVEPADTDNDTSNEAVAVDGSSNEWSPWQDPVTKQHCLVNTRTGMTATLRTGAVTHHEDVSIQPLPPALRDWQPDVFAAPSQQDIAKVTTTPIDELQGLRRSRHDDQNRAHKITRDQLRNAHIIAQVDNKFIFCRVPAVVETYFEIVLLDQHAASERVILEGLLSHLCSQTPGMQLEKPIIFEITAYESKLFEAHSHRLSRWGIAYDTAVDTLPMTASQVRPAQLQHRVVVQQVPAVIAERCRATPQLLIELLRGEVWKQTMTSDVPSPIDYSSSSPAWPSRLGSCPKGLLDMVNSRACRSAIMFNDVLTVQHCEGLIADLAQTVFPFINTRSASRFLIV